MCRIRARADACQVRRSYYGDVAGLHLFKTSLAEDYWLGSELSITAGPTTQERFATPGLF